MRRLALLALAAVLVPSLAAAEPTAEPAAAPPGTRSTAVAYVLVTGATAGGLALVALGDLHSDALGDTATAALVATGVGLGLVGPSVGHFYAGEYRRGLVTAGIRGAGLLGFTMGGLAMAFADDHAPAPAWAAPMAWAGAAALIGSTAYDLIDTPRAVRRANARSALSLQPTALAARDGLAPGLSLSGRF